ncbi:hypothetical protein [Pseudonocardia sp. WMMC193]|uniref:hypothetical protein n=1 Tax=Pseudonocardia sp. WMMC193 TaxID=2911965 RepID=UPI001F1FD092|nr:hypothetical protein [Pseudonocardia sp. WMMC193]MCF7552647.1 hypothetical protein [Pseudonocardia sp. WMMC193]
MSTTPVSRPDSLSRPDSPSGFVVDRDQSTVGAAAPVAESRLRGLFGRIGEAARAAHTASVPF